MRWHTGTVRRIFKTQEGQQAEVLWDSEYSTSRGSEVGSKIQ